MEIIFLRQAHRFVKKADPPLKARIKEEVLKIGSDPEIDGRLHGKLKNLRSHHFFFVKSQYRIAYEVKKNLIIVYVASRENFYKDLQI